MNARALAAFHDELVKIAKAKRAGFLTDVASNVGNTLKAVTNPVAAVKAGWNTGGWSMLSESPDAVRNSLKGKALQAMPGNKAMTLGFSALSAKDALSEEDPSGQGMSRGERLGRLAGGTVLGLASTPYMKGGLLPSLASGMLASTAGEVIGGHVGRLADKKLKARKGSELESHAPARPGPASPQSTQGISE